MDAARETVLVVDDEKSQRAMLRRLLESHGYAVAEAADGVQALSAVASAAPDVVLLDIMMPRMDGLEVCRRLKTGETTSHIPVLLITGDPEPERRYEAMDAGADDFLTKPLDRREVLLRVRNAVRGKRLYDRTLADYRSQREVLDRRARLHQVILNDLRAPLSLSSLALDMVLNRDGSERERHELLVMAREQIQRLAAVIDTVIDLSRIEEGQPLLGLCSCDLELLTREAVADVQGLVSQQQVTLEVDAEASLPEWPCDPGLIRRVIAHVLRQAVRTAPAQGGIRLVLRRRETALRLTVCMAGTGAPMPVLPAPGLESDFCRLAVEAHGGRLGIDRSTDGGGTFWIELPLAPPTRPGAARAPA